ncbi:MAG TPA: hypothetical protein VGI74_06965 [Streptosporangiaceae bacterium]
MPDSLREQRDRVPPSAGHLGDPVDAVAQHPPERSRARAAGSRPDSPMTAMA